jgi:Uracil DNA glycosylase superfamily
LSAPAVTDAHARVPGFDAEAVKRNVEGCRDCAAISTILLPPQEFMAKYLKRDYRDLNEVHVVVIGRHGPSRRENYYYANHGSPNRFVDGLYDLLGIKDVSEFVPCFALTDVIRCHATGLRIPERALANCARHLRNELRLFPNLDTLIVLGEDACLGVQRFLLGREAAEIQPFGSLMGSKGWAEETLRLQLLDNRQIRIFYCYHPSIGYRRSPSIAATLAR